MEYLPEILGDFTEEANVMVCIRHFTNEKETGQIADRLDLSLIFVLSQLKDAIRRKCDEVTKVALDYKRDESTENKSDCLQQGIPVGRK